MKKIAIGILAHVDSGKTTLSEALLYTAGVIKNRGRVDHKNAFLDTNLIEKERGITIFAKQAVIVTDDVKITLVDTPGHVDFSAETERTLGVLDYAVLVVNGAEGVQSHTETLWKLLERYNVPTLIFVNKMDVATADRGLVLKDIKENLSENCTQVKNSGWFEDVALCDDMLLEEFLASGEIKKESLAENLRERKFFPCFFGSALKNEGIEELLLFVQNYTKETCGTDEFGARIFKISQDEKGNRLTHLKVTSGKIGVKTLIKGDGWEEKVNEIRIYSGAKYESVQEAGTGEICAVLGFSKAAAGEVLGVEKKPRKTHFKAAFQLFGKIACGH